MNHLPLRYPSLIFGFYTLLTAAVFAAPITLKEIDFLVRQGTPENEIIQEVTTRRLLTPLDAKTEKLLKDNGATDSLLKYLKTPDIVLSKEATEAEIKRLKERQLQLKENLTTLQIEAMEAKAKAEFAARQTALKGSGITLKEDGETFAPNSGGSVKSLLKDQLVKLEGGALKPYDNSNLNQIKLYAFYYSAAWCGPCRKFTPKLVDAYKKLKARYPEFELIFVSNDRDVFNMTEYMKSYKMPWPAVRLESTDAVSQWSGKSIPWLVAVSEKGEPLTKNGQDKQYIPPNEILEGIEYLLKQVAPQR